MEQIAEALDVSKATISSDLRNCSVTEQLGNSSTMEKLTHTKVTLNCCTTQQLGNFPTVGKLKPGQDLKGFEATSKPPRPKGGRPN
jgi:hypothetical protein